MADEISEKRKQALAVNLTFYMLKTGDTQARIAEKTGISPSALSSYVQAQRYPSPSKLDALAKYFHTTVEELTDDPTKGNGGREMSNEARWVAQNYDRLDSHGRQLVSMVVQQELNRVFSG